VTVMNNVIVLHLVPAMRRFPVSRLLRHVGLTVDIFCLPVSKRDTVNGTLQKTVNNVIVITFDSGYVEPMSRQSPFTTCEPNCGTRFLQILVINDYPSTHTGDDD